MSIQSISKKSNLVLFFGLFFLISANLTSPFLSEADPLDVWRRRNPDNDLSGITFGNGIFVAVDTGGAILTSPDGKNWTTRFPETIVSLGGVAWGNNTFVAVGNNGTILSSPDTINWTIRTSGTALSLRSVTFGGGFFVAVGEAGTVLTSPDGMNWTQQASGVTDWITGITFGNSIFAALVTTVLTGPNGIFVPVRCTVITSPDGVTWTATGFSTGVLNDIAFGNETFVAVGGGMISPSSGSADLVVTSPDGLNWTTTRNHWPSFPFSGIAFGNGTFVAVNQSASLTSPDGANWTVRNSGSFRLQRVAFGNSSFVAVGGATLVSPDGIDWTVGRPAPIVTDLGAVTFANNLFVAVGYGGLILTSPDGVNWTQQTSGTTRRLNGVVYAIGIFVVVGELGTVLTSSDGVNWTPQTSPTISCCVELTYGNGVFAAAGGGHVITSTEGINWGLSSISEGSVPTGRGGVTFGNGTFVAAGSGGAISTSPDGLNWTFQTDTATPIAGVEFGNGVFAASGAKYVSPSFLGMIFTSPDGISWTTQISDSSSGRLLFANSIFLRLGGQNGAILTSPDALNWTPAAGTLGTTNIITGVAFGNRTFVAVGEKRIILQSDPLIFSDVQIGHWAEGHIESILDAGITTGCSAEPSLFCPDANITRGEMAVFIETSLGQSTAPTCTGTVFSDVDAQTVGTEFCGYIEDFAAKGITGGCQADNPATPDVNEAKYCPNDPITRAQMAVFIEAAIGGVAPSPCSETLFGDVTNLSLGPAFCDYIEKLASDGITGGCGTGSFCPNNPVTRAEMAVFLVAAPAPLSP